MLEVFDEGGVVVSLVWGVFELLHGRLVGGHHFVDGFGDLLFDDLLVEHAFQGQSNKPISKLI